MYLFEIWAEGIFVTFPWWLENVKSRTKIALFSNERHCEIWFPKKRTITFFWSKLSKLHKKDPILHMATTFSLKQGETRTSHVPIQHPLMRTSSCQQKYFWFYRFILRICWYMLPLLTLYLLNVFLDHLSIALLILCCEALSICKLNVIWSINICHIAAIKSGLKFNFNKEWQGSLIRAMVNGRVDPRFNPRRGHLSRNS